MSFSFFFTGVVRAYIVRRWTQIHYCNQFTNISGASTTMTTVSWIIQPNQVNLMKRKRIKGKPLTVLNKRLMAETVRSLQKTWSSQRSNDKTIHPLDFINLNTIIIWSKGSATGIGSIVLKDINHGPIPRCHYIVTFFLSSVQPYLAQLIAIVLIQLGG